MKKLRTLKELPKTEIINFQGLEMEMPIPTVQFYHTLRKENILWYKEFQGNDAASKAVRLYIEMFYNLSKEELL